MRRRWVTAAASVLTIASAGCLPAWPGPAAAATGEAPEQATLLVLGDSLSAEYGLVRGSGWVALLQARLAQTAPAWRIINASISGETTSGGASRIDSLIERHDPALVIVELGGNDALRGLDLTATRRNLDRIVAAAQGAGARVLLLGMQVPPNYGRAYTDAFEAVFSELATARELSFVPFFLDPIADKPSYFQADRIHPNAAAQPLMLDAVWPALQPLLPAPLPAPAKR